MAQAFSSSGGMGVLLFDEDFDLPASPPEPEIIQPLFTAAELMAARDEAARDSRDATLAEAEDSTRMAVGRALEEIAAQLRDARAEALTLAEQSSEALVCLLLGCFASAFPALSARHGQAELIAMLREILPVLHREPKITIRLSPHLLANMSEEIHAMDADHAGRVRLIATDALRPGDIRVNWENGAASRDMVSLWAQIESILAPAGLLNAEQIVKEHELVE